MVLAGSEAKQVQWTNVYQDALVRMQDSTGWICANVENALNKHYIHTEVLTVYMVWVLSLQTVGSWHGSNWDSPCI